MEHAEEQVDAKIGSVPLSIKGLNMPLMIAFLLLVGASLWYLAIENRNQHQALLKAVNSQTAILLAPEEVQRLQWLKYQKILEGTD
jgi:hypothetical protein